MPVRHIARTIFPLYTSNIFVASNCDAGYSLPYELTNWQCPAVGGAAGDCVYPLWFTDIFGSLKTVMMSSAELERAFEEGVGFDGSSLEGFSRISESDTLLRPDPSTYQPLPFDEDSGIQTARMFCDITMPDRGSAIRRPTRGFTPPVERRALHGLRVRGQPGDRVLRGQTGRTGGGADPG